MVRVRGFLVSAVMGVLVLGGALHADLAFASAPVLSPVVTAYGAPDGIFVRWTPNPSTYVFVLTRTVQGQQPSTMKVTGQAYGDTDVAPGQSVTYVVAVSDGGQGSLATSEPVTATREEQGWTLPAGAHNVLLAGADQPRYGGAQPSVLESPTFQRSFDGTALLSNFPFALNRLPGLGHVDLSGGDGGPVLSYCGKPEPASAEVYDLVYGASGLPLQLGADFTVVCQGETSHYSLRFNSPTPLPRVTVVGPARTSGIDLGAGTSSSWVIHNGGDAPATLGTVSATVGTSWPHQMSVSPVCDGVLLEPGQDCRLTVGISAQTTDFPGDALTWLVVPVTGQPTASASTSTELWRPLTPPQNMAVTGRSIDQVGLAWDTPVGTDPLDGAVIERRVGAGPWSVIATVPPAPGEWADKGVTAGSTVTYRLSSHTGSGQLSDPSDDLTVVVPTTAFATQYWLGGDPADSRNALYIPQWGPGTNTWIDASPDRAHLAITTMGTRSGDPGRIYITDTRGDHPRALAALPIGDGASFHRARYAPDGKRLAVTAQYGASDVVMIVDVNSGAAIRTLAPQGEPHGWSADGTSVLMGPGINRYGAPVQGLRWVRVTDDYETPIVAAAAFTTDGPMGVSRSAAVARDGSVAWISTTAGAYRILRAAPGATVATVLWAPTGCVLGDLAFAPTGAQLSVGLGGAACTVGRGGTVKLDVPTTGAATSSHPFTWFAAAGAWIVATNAAPSVAVAVPGVTGPRAVIATTVADPDHALAGLSTTCRIDSTAPVPCSRSWSTPTLGSGRHTVAVTVTDPAGATSTQSTAWVVDTAAPTVTAPALPPVVLGTTLSVSWAGVDAGGAGLASYDARVRTAALGAGLGAYVSPASWQGVTTASLSTVLAAGSTACFSVRARDKAGNLGGYGPERCTSSVLDDRSLRSTGTRGTGAGYLYGTWTIARGSAQQLVSATVVTRQIGLYVTGCPTCGSVDVYIGTTRIGRLSTTTPTTSLRRVLWLPAFATRSGTLTLRPVTSAPVIIDGVAILK